MKDWKTTLAGLLTALGVYCATVPELHGFGVLLNILGPILLGYHAQDSNDAPPAKPSGFTPRLMLFLLLGTLCLGFTACKTSQVAAAYKAENATVHTVDAAMTAWGDYVTQFHPGVAAELKVKAAFDRYQKVLLTTVDVSQIAALNAGTNAPTGLTTVPTELQTAIADLLATIQSFGVKL